MNKVDYKIKNKDSINYIIWRIEWQTPRWKSRGS